MKRPDVKPQSNVDFAGVPEALFRNLYFRASEAMRPDAVLTDPRAVELVETIDYPFEERFGRVSALRTQAHALRSCAFDRELEQFLERYPDGTVVALGEGLETQSWRVDNGQMRWLTVELPETVTVRRTLLPDSPRRRVITGSVLDGDWMDQVDTSHAVLISAQGLLMYMQPSDVHGLIQRCADRFPGAHMLFDVVPRWFSRRTEGSKTVDDRRFQPPPMSWGVGDTELAAIRDLPGVKSLREVALPQGRGFIFRRMVPLMPRLPVLRWPPLGFVSPWIILHAEFRRVHDGSDAYRSFVERHGPVTEIRSKIREAGQIGSGAGTAL